MGVLCCQTGRNSEALHYFESAVSVAPELAAAHNNLGTLRLNSGDIAAAEADFRQAIRLDPAYPEAYYHLGSTLRRQLRYREAESAFRKALELKPDYHEALNNLGDVLMGTGRLEEAEGIFMEVLALRSEYPQAHNNLGCLLELKEDLHGAALAYSRAIELLPGDAEAGYNLGRVLHRLGKTVEATAVLQTAQQAAADNPVLAERVRQALARLVPSWHFTMLNNETRNQAYAEALQRQVRPGMRVLDIGTGSGLLSLLALRAGADQVVSCEISPLLAAAARDIIRDNGGDQQIKVVTKPSYELRVGVDLPERAELMVSEVFGSDLLSEGVLNSVEHARRNLLVPGAISIPRAANVQVCLASGPGLARLAFVQTAAGFDMRQFNRFVPSHIATDLQGVDWRPLSEATTAFSFDFTDDAFPPEHRELLLTATENGECLGLLQWLRIELDDTVSFENRPGDAMVCLGWTAVFYPFQQPYPVSAGQQVRVSAEHNRMELFFCPIR